MSGCAVLATPAFTMEWDKTNIKLVADRGRKNRSMLLKLGATAFLLNKSHPILIFFIQAIRSQFCCQNGADRLGRDDRRWHDAGVAEQLLCNQTHEKAGGKGKNQEVRQIEQDAERPDKGRCDKHLYDVVG